LTGEQVGRRPAFFQRRRFTLGDSPTAVDSKMAANELVREGVLVMRNYLVKECQHILEKRNKRKNDVCGKQSHITFW
jgi:hypothetical protein